MNDKEREFIKAARDMATSDAIHYFSSKLRTAYASLGPSGVEALLGEERGVPNFTLLDVLTEAKQEIEHVMESNAKNNPVYGGCPRQVRLVQRLQLEIEKAAALCEEKTCKWKEERTHFRTGCGRLSISIPFEFCPHCGGKVEVVR